MFTPPKNKRTRYVPMHDDVRAALESARGCDETFCFVNNFGSHWRISSRAYHWNAVRAAVGWDKDLYLASRHFAGWMMYEVMGMKDADVGTALGHTGRDVGKLVRETYGHHNDAAAHQRAREAWRSRNRPDELRAA
jgi:integrase